MASFAPENDFSHLQDVLGNLPMLKRYIIITLCFHLNQPASLGDVESALKTALRKLKDSFPFLAGQVIYEGRDESHTGTRKIVSLADSIQLLVNDLRDDPDFPTMAEMRIAGYPFSMLDPGVLAPPIAVSWSGDGFDKIAPVLVLQATFVKGGMLLTICGNHTTMDMTGLGMIISLFSKACRNEPFTEEEIKESNQSRKDAVPLLGDDYQPGPELDDSLVVSSSDNVPEGNNPISPPKWAYFNFRSERLVRLKEEASRQSLVPYISTDDAIGALCWQCISRARTPSLGKETVTYFARPTSVRKWLGLKGYIGHMAETLYTSETNVWERPLGEIAAKLRLTLLQDAQIKYHVRAFATLVDRLSDKSKLLYGARLDPNRDVVLSSYANIRCCELSFGPVLGSPDAARRPRMPAWPSLLYCMPRSKDGDIAVAFCLREDELIKLREDALLASWADYIG